MTSLSPRSAERPSATSEGFFVALVAGVWAAALLTGPAMRLIMRLLAATAGDAAQGRITEAEEVVGNIDFEGTFGLYVFGGILPGLLSGFIYVLVRRWLPAGRMGGVVFGLLHLIIAATRIDPLRPENIDFSLVGPGWLALSACSDSQTRQFWPGAPSSCASAEIVGAAVAAAYLPWTVMDLASIVSEPQTTDRPAAVEDPG